MNKPDNTSGMTPIQHNYKSQKMISFGNNSKSGVDIRMMRSAEGTAFEIAIAIINICMWIMIAYLWRHLPEQIAIHFDVTGTADGWGTKWMMPLTGLIGSFVSALLCFSAYRPSRYINMPFEMKNPAQHIAAVRMVRILGVMISLMFLCIAWGMAGNDVAGSLTISLVVATIAVTAWYTARIRRLGQ